jgi:hypothetical protein
MLTVSTGFQEAIKSSAVYSNGYVVIDNGTTELTFDSDELTKIEISGSALANDKVLGNLAQHSLSLELLGDQTANIDLTKENIVRAFIGVKVGSSFEYVQFQDFLILECSYSDTSNVTTISGADYLIRLNKEYVDTNDYTSPITLITYVQSVLTFCGLGLENTSFLNSTYSLASAPFSDFVSAKEIIQKAAELALCYVVINKTTNNVEFKSAFEVMPTTETHADLSAYTHEDLSAFSHFTLSFGTGGDEGLDKNNYWNFKLKDHNFGANGVNTLVLGLSQVEGENNTVENGANVAIDGSIEIKIMDNDFINTEDKRLSVINAMFTAIDGYKFQPYVLDYIGFPYLELGDLVVVEKMDNTPIAVPIFETMIRYDGGLLGQIKAIALNKTQTSNKYLSQAKQRIRNAEIRVDKVEGNITLIASEVTELGENYSSLQVTVDGINATVADQEGRITTVEQSVDSITDTINSVNDDLQQVKTVFRETADGFEITKTVDLGDGNVKIASITSGFDVDNNAYIKIDDGGSDVAIIQSNQMSIANAVITNSLTVGNHKITSFSTGDTIWQKIS